MRKPTRFATLPGLVLAVPLTLASSIHISPAQAQTAAANASPSTETKAAARAAYGAGEAAYQAGDYETAQAKFEEANRLIPSIHAQYWRGMTLARLGKVPEAHAALTAVLADDGASKLGAEKADAARAELEALERVPAEVDVRSTPPGALVTLDGSERGQTPLTLELAPGTHQMVLTLDGHAPKTAEVSLKPGEKATEEVTLEALPPPAPAEPAPEVEPEPAPPPEKQERSLVPAYVTLGVAGASAIVGTIFGIQALNAKSDYDAAPSRSLADDAERNALIADMAFGVTLTLGITGVVLLMAGDDSELAAKRPAPPRTARWNVAPYASPRGGGAAARVTF
jgi:tetratricopeptide (TPR) repeat protein